MYRSSKLYFIALGLLFSVAVNAGWLNSIIGYDNYEECFDEVSAELMTREKSPLKQGDARRGAKAFCNKYPRWIDVASAAELRKEIKRLKGLSCDPELTCSMFEERIRELQGLIKYR